MDDIKQRLKNAALSFYEDTGRFPTSNDVKVRLGFPCGERKVYGFFGSWDDFKRFCGLGILSIHRSHEDERSWFLKQTTQHDECLVWGGMINQGGYGVLKNKNRSWLAHRWAYTIFVKNIPKGKIVRHQCGNRLCVNPKHLTLGTHRENSRDTVMMGRYHKGQQTRLFPHTRRPETLVQWILNNGVDDVNGCLEVHGAPTSNGYSYINYGGVKYYAHRFVKCVLESKSFSTELVVRHLCHNRRCVNPEHLAFGSRRDNALDTINHRK